MGTIGLTEKKRNGESAFEQFDIAKYTNKMFGKIFFIFFRHIRRRQNDRLLAKSCDPAEKLSADSHFRNGESAFEQFDIAKYTNKMFGMFGGEECMLTIQFTNRLVGVVLDRFGKEADIRKRDEEHFSVRVKVAVSGQFMVFKSLISLYLVVLLTSIGYLSKCVNAFRLQIAFKSANLRFIMELLKEPCGNEENMGERLDYAGGDSVN